MAHTVSDRAFVKRPLNGSLLFFVLIGAVLLGHVICAVTETRDDWILQGRRELRRAISVARHQNKRLAKNVILFIGDGMGISTVTAARIREGQLRGEHGEENLLFFERFPHVGLMKTYNADAQVPDSAGAGTAMLTGVKVNSGVLGLDGRVTKGNCSAVNDDNKLKTILHAFLEEGLSTGIVTNSRITHATPAAAYAHIPHREWEGDVEIPRDMEGCDTLDDIAKQLVRENKDIKVLLGGGRRYFLDNSTIDPETGMVDSRQRQDGLNLIAEWQADKASRGLSHSYVWNKEDFQRVDPASTDYLLGLFSPSHMDYDLEHQDDLNTTLGEPDLEEMTEKAIEVLGKDSRGYFLVVEGARIDWGHHANSAYMALSETIALSRAVEKAVRLTSRRDTLIIVTADHSHSFAVQGYSERGTDILGLSNPPTNQAPIDDLPYTTLAYTNGPQYGRSDLINTDTASPTFRQSSCIPLSVETHAGEDVSAYALGPMAHLIHSTHEQNYLYHVMEYAACVGGSKEFCRHKESER